MHVIDQLINVLWYWIQNLKGFFGYFSDLLSMFCRMFIGMHVNCFEGFMFGLFLN